MAHTLRCHRCSMYIGESEEVVQLAIIFKASLVGRVPRQRCDEVRKRCKSCGWVHVLLPVAADVQQAS